MAATEFDREFKLVTSYAFKPIILAYIRLLVALYVLAVLIFQFAWEGSKRTGELDSYVICSSCFSYNPKLTIQFIVLQLFVVLYQFNVHWSLRLLLRLRRADIMLQSELEERSIRLPPATKVAKILAPSSRIASVHYCHIS